MTEDSLKDTGFTVKVVDKLIKLTGASSRGVKNDIAHYKIPAQVLDEDFQGQQACKFQITAQNVVNSSTFKYFSTKSNNSLIKTEIEIIGNNTNSTIKIPVTIQNNIIT